MIDQGQHPEVARYGSLAVGWLAGGMCAAARVADETAQAVVRLASSEVLEALKVEG